MNSAVRTGGLLTALVLATSTAVLAPACGGIPDDRSGRQSADANVEKSVAVTFSGEDVRSYMRQLAPYLVSRELEQDEIGRLDSDKFAAIAPMLVRWTKEPSFPLAARRLIAQKLSVSGSRDGIDFDLPGNLAEFVVRNDLPLSTLLTADYCVNANGAKIKCDSGAPFEAGVLTTRAFLASRASRFNLTRASTLMRTFVCEAYPMKETVEPRLPRSRLIPMFQVDKEVDENGMEKDTFGNGSACYGCHGQFGAHAQLFVRFDEKGVYRADATGVQDAKGELGRSQNGLYASHLNAPAEAKSDTSQMLGQQVANVREAAKVLAASPKFVPCQVANILEYALRLPPPVKIAQEVLDEISAGAQEAGEPTFSSLVVETFSHPRIVSSVVSGLGGEQ